MSLITIILSFFLLLSPPQHDSIFVNGEKELEKGEWKKALNIWYSAKQKISNAKDIDPRIGFNYIKFVTKTNKEKYYSLAAELYFWSLKAENFDEYGEYLHEEMERLKPIVNSDVYEFWEELYEQNYHKLLTEIKSFWVKINPYPSSKYNERLIEHWERIAYARKDFTEAKNTVFNTDDRGIIYVKYGEPDRKKRRNIFVTSVTEPTSGTIINLNNNLFVSFELWYYDFEKKKTISFMFGKPANGGNFGLQPGIFNIIPVAGNRISSYLNNSMSTNNLSQLESGSISNLGRQESNLNNSSNNSFMEQTRQITRNGADLMLKYAVLDRIAAIDHYHYDLFHEMTADIVRTSSISSGEPFSTSANSNLMKYEAKEKSNALARDTDSPDNTTETKSNLGNLEINYKIYNFLNENYTALHMVAVDNHNFENLLALHIAKQTSQIKPYRIDTFYIYDDDWNIIKEDPQLYSVNSISDKSMPFYLFSEESELYNNNNTLLFVSQLVNFNAPNLKDAKHIHKKFNAEILGSSENHIINFTNDISVNYANRQLMLSDPFFSIVTEEDTTQRIPFTPYLNPIFKKEDSPKVYFEVYGVKKFKDYNAKVYFEKVKDNGKIKRDKETSITLNYVSEGKINKNWFSVNLNNLSVKNNDYQNYNLVLMVYRPGQDFKLKKKVSFKLKK